MLRVGLLVLTVLMLPACGGGGGSSNGAGGNSAADELNPMARSVPTPPTSGNLPAELLPPQS